MFNKKFKLIVACVLMVSTLTACTSQEITLVENIVKAVELAVPIVEALAGLPGVPTAVVNGVLNYVDGAAMTASTFLSNVSTAGLTTAIMQFNTLVVPQISADTSPDVAKQITTIDGLIGPAIAAFTMNFTGATTVTASNVQLKGVYALVPPGKTYKVRSKDLSKYAEYQNRLQAVRNRVKTLRKS